MNVLLVSECDKRALTETRRILDQFAERRGERTWQTAITQAGLDALRRLLRKTARKNTAVACHWIRARDHSELLWIVGDASRYNAEGAVPTNTTVNDVLRRRDENDWHTAEDIRLLAQLAALLHDLGKASVAFQARLAGRLVERNRYRHEWVSLRLFLAFVGADDDEHWLQRLADAERCRPEEWLAAGRYQRDGIDPCDRYPFRGLPPLAAAIGWLVVTHHRLPAPPAGSDSKGRRWWGKRAGYFEAGWLDAPLDHVEHEWNEIPPEDAKDDPAAYWTPAGELPVMDAGWRQQAARVARRLLALRQRRDAAAGWLGNPYVMHLARLSLMLADHDYSRLGVDDTDRPLEQRRPFLRPELTLHANTRTDKRSGRKVLNQSLVEHLLGVGHAAGLVAHALPGFERHLPRLANHRGLRKRSGDPRYGWQDKAYDAAASLRESAREHGAFIVNMASTGCGKTLGNARILYALADPQQGLRASYALGLRTLTLQTGRSYRRDLHLGEDELAVLVGGSASLALFEHYEAEAEAGGSASVQALIEEDSHVLYEGHLADHPLLSRALADERIRRLLSAPMLVSTVDHLVPATEARRAGRQIAPMLRLMSADLVLDELDDYDLNDLPALTRLVHWAGLLGSRIVLSSATLPPALVEGMYRAYRAGREQHRRNRGASGGSEPAPLVVPCLWVDEFGVQAQPCADGEAYAEAHRAFVDRRLERLSREPPLRRVELLSLRLREGSSEQLRRRRHHEFAASLRTACVDLHRAHAKPDPISGKRVSFGIVRMANIDPLIEVAAELYRLGAPDEGAQLHLCVYHARFPLVQRSEIEHHLDQAFDRRGDGAGVFRLASVRSAIDAHAAPDQLFVVLASPVCEVGRDWDADWAIAEPSSMRALIQLAGRVQRHRREPPTTANVRVFETNLRHYAGRANEPAFIRPGFETEDTRFRLKTHGLLRLLQPAEYQRLDAAPRIRPRPAAERSPDMSLVDLEHARIEAAMHWRKVPPLERDHAAPGWHCPQLALTGVLAQEQPFRHDDLRPTETLVFLPDEDKARLVPHIVVALGRPRDGEAYVPVEGHLLHRIALVPGRGITPWIGVDEDRLLALLTELADPDELPLKDAARKFTVVEVPGKADQGWRWHPLLGYAAKRSS